MVEKLEALAESIPKEIQITSVKYDNKRDACYSECDEPCFNGPCDYPPCDSGA